MSNSMDYLTWLQDQIKETDKKMYHCDEPMEFTKLDGYRKGLNAAKKAYLERACDDGR